MYQTRFVFACREVVVHHMEFCTAVLYARTALKFHWKTVQCVEIYGSRRDNYPHVLTVKRAS